MLNKIFHNQNEDQERDGQKSNALLNRRRLFKKGGWLVGMLSALSLTPFSWAEADAQSAAGSVQIVNLTGADAAKYVQPTITSGNYLQFKQQLTQKYPNTFTIQENSAVAFIAQNSSDKVVSVHIPVQGGAGYSFFAAMLQPDTATVMTTRSGVFLPASNGNTTVVLKQNGTIVANAVVDSKGTFVSGTLTTSKSQSLSLNGLSAKEVVSRVSTQATAGSSDWWGCMNQCLSGLGIASWVLAAVGTACAIACLGTAGAGCVACILGASAITGGEAGYCVGQCSN